MTYGSASTTGTGVEGEFQNSRGCYCNVYRDSPGRQQKAQTFNPPIQSMGLTSPQQLQRWFSAADSADLETCPCSVLVCAVFLFLFLLFILYLHDNANTVDSRL